MTTVWNVSVHITALIPPCKRVVGGLFYIIILLLKQVTKFFYHFYLFSLLLDRIILLNIQEKGYLGLGSRDQNYF
jgi:hypothetical protein